MTVLCTFNMISMLAIFCTAQRTPFMVAKTKRLTFPGFDVLAKDRKFRDSQRLVVGTGPIR